MLRKFAYIMPLLCVGLGCIGSLPPDPETSYASEMRACVIVAKTLEESHACRCEVDRRWGYGAVSQYCRK